MSQPTDEGLSLYEIDLHYKQVRLVDGFGNMQQIIRYLKEYADRNYSYSVGDIASNIKAVAFFSGDDLLLLTAAREVVCDTSVR